MPTVPTVDKSGPTSRALKCYVGILASSVNVVMTCKYAWRNYVKSGKVLPVNRQNNKIIHE